MRQYVGGVAGFIGKETLLEDAGFIVNNDNTSNITSYLVAGGIVGQFVNNDFIKTGSDFLGATKIQEYSSFGNCVEVCKNRMFGVVDYLVGMYYEIESRRFKSTIDEHIIYGWQDNPQQQTIQVESPNVETPKVEYPIVNPYEMESEDVIWGQGIVPF